MSFNADQYERVITKHYKDHPHRNLLIVSVMPSDTKLLKFELSHGEMYPHYYGILFWNDVTSMESYQPAE